MSAGLKHRSKDKLAALKGHALQEALSRKLTGRGPSSHGRRSRRAALPPERLLRCKAGEGNIGQAGLAHRFAALRARPITTGRRVRTGKNTGKLGFTDESRGSDLAGADVSGNSCQSAHKKITGKAICNNTEMHRQNRESYPQWPDAKLSLQNAAPVAAFLRNSTRRGKHGARC